ncbi:MAG: hypothetical protein QF609_02315 [Gammaproteobacteria bacterium]|nr:hypothetical protein [Gammaproteobacteria bacterium]
MRSNIYWIWKVPERGGVLHLLHFISIAPVAAARSLANVTITLTCYGILMLSKNVAGTPVVAVLLYMCWAGIMFNTTITLEAVSRYYVSALRPSAFGGTPVQRRFG